MNTLGPDSLRALKEKDLFEDAVDWHTECDNHADAWQAERETSEMHYLRAQTRIMELENENVALQEKLEEEYAHSEEMAGGGY